MRIPDNIDPRTNKVQTKPAAAQQKTHAPETTKKSKGDELVISKHAAEVNKFRELAKTVPDIRKEKVEDIKKRLEAGIYNVSPEAVARSIIELHKITNHKDEG